MARAAFGDQVVDHYLNYARTEQALFDQFVTDWERMRLLRARVRVVLISEVAPAVEGLSAMLRAHGHEPVALLCVRREAERYTELSELIQAAPPDIDIVMPASRGADRSTPAPFEPDVALCIGFPWKIPPDALAVSAARHRERPSVAAPAIPRPEPGLVGDPQRRERDRLHVPLHGRRARHGEHPRSGTASRSATNTRGKS